MDSYKRSFIPIPLKSKRKFLIIPHALNRISDNIFPICYTCSLITIKSSKQFNFSFSIVNPVGIKLRD